MKPNAPLCALATMMATAVAAWPTDAEAQEPSSHEGGSSGDAYQNGDGIEVLTGGFVGTDWRVMGLGGHVSHGPGFQAGVILFRHLKIGLAGFARPGPINPATFEVTAAAGRSYKGSSTLTLKSDGALLGLMLAPTIDVADIVAFEAPVTLGQAAFGFYLSGDDRDTPDGRRVSEWENELLDGRDSSVGLGLDAGLRVSLIAASWIRPFVGVHYTTVFGYDAYVRDDYDGLSGVLGIQLGKFR